MNTAQRAITVAAIAAVAAVTFLVTLIGVVPALGLAWAGSLATIVGVLGYEQRRHAGTAVELVADIVVVPEPVASLVDTDPHAPRGKLSHRHPRRAAHEKVRAGL